MAEETRPWRLMTLEEARSRIPERTLPGFWCGGLARLDEHLAAVQAGEVSTMGTSPGGRPIRLVAYGERESAGGKANFNSAVAAREPSAYMDRASRTKPVVFFVGPVHGHEVEGLTGLVNLMHVMETGADLRGRPQDELRALAERCRLLILPTGNPDGLARFEPGTLQGLEGDDIRFWGQGTWSDGRLCGWPQCKRVHPMRADQVSFLGCYYDDAGVNPMHDEFTRAMSASAPAILDVARREGPDLTAVLHSSGHAPHFGRPAYTPLAVQEHVRALYRVFQARLEPLGIPSGGAPEPRPEGGEFPASLNLTGMLYHVCGGVPFTFECPHGVRTDRVRLLGLEEILEVQLALYCSMLEFALSR
ncbi:MAG: hypothetical protein GXY85_11600 [Candidatus Brocadiaceae bacterium]|nr:hypothetical protein [Candidatus Brocadiaceae bacterium]